MQRSVIGLLVIFALGTLWPPLVAAPLKKVPTIGVLTLASPPSEPDWKQRSVFLQELRHLGWVEGQNITVEYRWTSERSDRLADVAAELVRVGQAVPNHTRDAPAEWRRKVGGAEIEPGRARCATHHHSGGKSASELCQPT